MDIYEFNIVGQTMIFILLVISIDQNVKAILGYILFSNCKNSLLSSIFMSRIFLRWDYLYALLIFSVIEVFHGCYD